MREYPDHPERMPEPRSWPKQGLLVALTLVLLLILAGCERDTDPGRTASVTLIAGDSGMTGMAFGGTFDQVTSITAQAFNGATLLDTASLTGGGATWSGTLYNLPVGPTLTLIAEGFNASSLKIFAGTLNTSVAEVGNSITISMLPLDDGTGFPTPTVQGILLPQTIVASSTVAVELQVSGAAGTNLDFQLLSGGGAFFPASGTIALDGAGNGKVTVDYTAPAATGIKSHSVTVSNAQAVSATVPFDTNVVEGRCVLDVSKLDNCALGP